MTGPTTPPAFDPTAPLRDVYRQAEHDLLAALTAAVTAGLADDATDITRAVAERQLRATTTRVVAGLNRQVPPLVDRILADAAAEGISRANLQ